MISWLLFLSYLSVTTFLAYRGWAKTRDFKSFALAGGLGPFTVGITLAASIASTATFVINPGFVYRNGISALIHFGVAAPLGFLLALYLFSKKFREQGVKYGALTLPDWVGKRYDSDAMRLYFAVLNLVLSIAFIVLIVKGSALIMQATLGLEYFSSLLVIVGFVFSYVLFGGTYAHAYTNSFQGAIMLVVAVLLVYSGFSGFSDGELLVAMAVKGQGLLRLVNPESAFFSTWYEVFVAAFIISMGLVCQPHILMKPLYLKNAKQVPLALAVTMAISLVYAGVLLVGLYAHIGIPFIEQQDTVMAVYVQNTFSPTLAAFISISLLAAGMSTLDGILVGVSTIAVNDIALNPIFGGGLSELRALRFSRIVLVLIGGLSLILAWNPPVLVGIFAQLGIYGLTAASLAPVLLGLYLSEVDRRKIFAASLLGPVVHFAVYFYSTKVLHQPINPAVTASYGIYASFILFVPEIWRSIILKPRH